MAEILVVDDMEGVRKTIGSMLKRGGHNVTPAANGIKAIDLLKSQRFDLVVTDILMPEGDGVGLIAELKKNQPNVRVLAISGGGRIIDSTDCLRIAQGLGAHAAVMKPFTRDQLLAAVNQALAPHVAPGPSSH